MKRYFFAHCLTNIVELEEYNTLDIPPVIKQIMFFGNLMRIGKIKIDTGTLQQTEKLIPLRKLVPPQMRR
jgi:hypothetical protein